MLPETIQKDSKLLYLLDTNYHRWEISDEEYLSYITPQIIIDKIISLADEHFQGLQDKVIWDMFAGVGCDGLRISLHAGKVICTEIKKDVYSDLVKNITNYGDNIVSMNVDCCSVLDKTRCNIVYFDPPWGDTFQSGMDFNFNDVTLDDGTHILELIDKIINKFDMIIIKSPISSKSFEKRLAEYTKNMRIFTFTQQKLKFLFIKKS